MLIIAIIVGAIAGLTWEMVANNPYKNIPTLFPSKYINGFHVHHWLWYIFLLLIVIIWSSKTGRLFHPAVLMCLVFLITALVYGFSRYPGWMFFK